MLKRNLHADLLKMNGHPTTLAHILIPIITSGVFLAYYSFSVWSDNTKIIAFDYSGPAAHLGRSLAQLDRASAHLIQSAFRHMPIADQPIY